MWWWGRQMALGFSDTLGGHKHTFHFDSDHKLSYRRERYLLLCQHGHILYLHSISSLKNMARKQDESSASSWQTLGSYFIQERGEGTWKVWGESSKVFSNSQWPSHTGLINSKSGSKAQASASSLKLSKWFLGSGWVKVEPVIWGERPA